MEDVFSSPEKEAINKNKDETTKDVEHAQASKKGVTIEQCDKLKVMKPCFSMPMCGVAGLCNLGNTCYMNSALQCLAHALPLAEYFVTDSYKHDLNPKNHQGSEGNISRLFADVVKAIWLGKQKVFKPKALKEAVGKYCATFCNDDQHDAQEFINWLMDTLHEDLNKITSRQPLQEVEFEADNLKELSVMYWQRYCTHNQSIIVNAFQGQLLSHITCHSCGHQSHSFDVFTNLLLHIPTTSTCTLDECLRNFSEEEKLTDWYCPTCKIQRSASKRIVIWKVPPVLIVVLKRFIHQKTGSRKHCSYVDFDLEDFNVNQYVAGPKSTGNYNLYAVSNHYGSVDSGHYSAHCRNGAGKWFEFNDDKVNEVSPSAVKTNAAYLLCYYKV